MTESMPSPDPTSAFTRDLEAAARGDMEARQRLWSEHYQELRDNVSQWYARHWQGRGDDRRISLDATDIVNEVYCRLVDRTAAMANGRPFFFAALYNECLRVAVDYYRKTKNDRGRGKHARVEMESRFLVDQRLEANVDIVADIVDELERNDPRMGQIARIKVFDNRPDPQRPGSMRGLTNEEIGEMLGIATRTVEQDWKFAKAFLMHRIATAT